MEKNSPSYHDDLIKLTKGLIFIIGSMEHVDDIYQKSMSIYHDLRAINGIDKKIFDPERDIVFLMLSAAIAYRNGEKESSLLLDKLSECLSLREINK